MTCGLTSCHTHMMNLSFPHSIQSSSCLPIFQPYRYNFLTSSPDVYRLTIAVPSLAHKTTDASNLIKKISTVRKPSIKLNYRCFLESSRFHACQCIKDIIIQSCYIQGRYHFSQLSTQLESFHIDAFLHFMYLPFLSCLREHQSICYINFVKTLYSCNPC